MGLQPRGANLTAADLSGADLWDTNLRGATLRGADLRGAEGCRISGTPSSLPLGWQVVGGCLIGPGTGSTLP